MVGLEALGSFAGVASFLSVVRLELLAAIALAGLVAIAFTAAARIGSR